MGKTSRSKYKHRKNYNQYTNATSSSNQSQASGSESDIPGYYYDEEKKTYFKILPNTMSSVGSFMTKETIKRNKDENRRLLDRNKATTENELPSPGFYSLSSKTMKTKPKNTVKPLLDVLSSVQCGQYTCQSLQTYMMRKRCLKLKPQPGWENGQRTAFTSAYVDVEGIQRIEMSADYDKAVAVWSIKGFIKQWMKLMTLTPKRKQNASDVGSHLNLTINDGEFLGTSPNKVTGMCWAAVSKVPDKACVLYTTVCPVGYSGSRVSIFNLEASSGEEAHIFSFDLGRHPVWSCAWNPQRSRFSVGCERKCHVIDVHTRCKWTYSTQNSDCLAQLFSASNPHLLYTGTRNGYVLILDLRTPRLLNHETAKFNHKSAVVCLRSVRDDNYLMASDYSGLIRTWDLRFQKTVKTYSGLVNSHYQIPFYLDDTEKFVYGTGSDGYCKIWDTSEGLLLKSIAPPLPSQSADSFPVSHVSQNWGGLHTNFGVVTAMANSFFLYS